MEEGKTLNDWVEPPVARTGLHSFDGHRQALHKHNLGDPRVIQELRMHPAPLCARGLGREKPALGSKVER
jgi:hypothetical protein